MSQYNYEFNKINVQCSVIFVHALSAVFLAWVHCDGEGVLLITAHVRITHVVEDVLVGTRRGRGSEVELHLTLALESQPLNGLQPTRGRGDYVMMEITITNGLHNYIHRNYSDYN